jgi:RNase P subunit RPR2
MTYVSGKELKTCKKCNELLPYDQFWNDKYTKDGKTGRCIACLKKRWNDKPRRPRKGRKEYVPPVEKFCKGCDQTWPASCFDIRYERGNGNSLRARCKKCNAKAHDSWREKNPGASRSRNLKSKYGISIDDYMKILDNQGGGCALCGSLNSKWATSSWLHLDHNHKTGEVRGLLCHTCNIIVGGIENTPEIDIDKLLKWCGM